MKPQSQRRKRTAMPVPTTLALLTMQRDLAVELAATLEVDQALNAILAAALRISGADAGGIYLKDPATGDLRLHALSQTGLSEEFVRQAAVVPAGSPRAQFVETGRTIYGAAPDEGVRREGLETVCVLPVVKDQEALACINLGYRTRRLPPPRCRRALETTAAQVSGVVMRLRVEEALRGSEQRFRETFKHLPIPAYLWRRVDGDFELLDYNQAGMVATAGQVAEIVGQRLSVYYAEREEIRDAITRVFAERRVVTQEFHYPIPHLPGERLLQVTYCYIPETFVLAYVDDITERRRAAQALQEAYAQLEREREELQNKNTALREILDAIEAGKQQTADQLAANMERLVLPLLARLERAAGPAGAEYGRHLQAALLDLTSPFVRRLERRFAALTPRELQICALIRGGATTKEIAGILGVGEETVRTQRKGIRRKLGLGGESTNLQAFLMLSGDAPAATSGSR